VDKVIANFTKVMIKVDPSKVAGDWTGSALRGRRSEGLGMVKCHHDSHGLCYEVFHQDFTVGAYESHELTEVKE
jgi:hypothetical protein